MEHRDAPGKSSVGIDSMWEWLGHGVRGGREGGSAEGGNQEAFHMEEWSGGVNYSWESITPGANVEIIYTSIIRT